MNDFIPKKKNVPVTLIDESFDDANIGVEIWYAEKSEAHHGVIIPLPVEKDGKRTADHYIHEKLHRKTVSKEAHAVITQFILAHNLNPADYLIATGNYWGEFYCFIDGFENITWAVIEAYITDRVRIAGTPRTEQ